MKLFDNPDLSTINQTANGLDRSYRYALAGLMLGVAAPVGWMLLHSFFFAATEQSFFGGILADVFASQEHLFHYLYMGLGTSVVLSIFGYFIGRAAQQIHQRAARLDEMHRTVAGQKEEFAQRYHDLNTRIRNFHGITARLQRSMDEEELYTLTANALHEVLEFDRVNLLTVCNDEGLLRMTTSLGSSDPQIGGVSLPLDERQGFSIERSWIGAIF